MWKLRDEEDRYNDFEMHISRALAAVELHGGTLLYTKSSDSPDGFNILGLNPVLEITENGIRAGTEKVKGELFSVVRSMREMDSGVGGDIPFLFAALAYDGMDRFEEPGVFPDLRRGDFPDIHISACEHLYIWKNQSPSDIRHIRLSFPFQHISVHPDDILKILRASHSDDVALNVNVQYLSTNIPRDRYKAAVNRIIDRIKIGDCYQVNMSRRIDAHTDSAPVDIAEKLCVSNEIEFGVVAKISGKWMISTSPERFFHVENGRICTSPIKGTAPRSADPDEDEILLQSLLENPKERAELSMITDLLRNDLSRVCEVGSVVVESFPLVKSLRNVHHLYSDISGELKSSDLEAILRAIFPGGSISGCPRIAACRIIAGEEGEGRGLYTGTYGYISTGGVMDFNILIRTVFVDGNHLSFNVGGGITVLSDPSSEWQETVDKASAIVAALDMTDYPQ